MHPVIVLPSAREDSSVRKTDKGEIDGSANSIPNLHVCYQCYSHCCGAFCCCHGHSSIESTQMLADDPSLHAACWDLSLISLFD